jgi:hypothetical protein
MPPQAVTGVEIDNEAPPTGLSVDEAKAGGPTIGG